MNILFYSIYILLLLIFYIAYINEKNKRLKAERFLSYSNDLNKKMVKELENEFLDYKDRVHFALEEYYSIPF